MNTIPELLLQARTLQELASIRGLELIMAKGCVWKMSTRPSEFEFGLDGVSMTFIENTNHVCPDSEFISLKIGQLEMSDQKWKSYIDGVKEQTEKKREDALKELEKYKLEQKQKAYEDLKKELGL